MECSGCRGLIGFVTVFTSIVQKDRLAATLALLRDQAVAGDYEKARYVNENPIEAALWCVQWHLDANLIVACDQCYRLWRFVLPGL